MKTWKRIINILKKTGAIKFFIGFIILLFISSILLTIFEPNISNIGDGLWYLFVASTTIGFGDFYAVSLLGRILTVLVAINGILLTAVLTGVILSYYMEYLNTKEKETVSIFLEKLEDLPNLSKKELETISLKVKEYNKKN